MTQSSPSAGSKHGAMSHGKHRKSSTFGRSSRSNISQWVARDVNRMYERVSHDEPMYDSIGEALEAARSRPLPRKGL